LKTLTIEVSPDEQGRTLQALLRERGGFSHAEARGLIDAGAVRGPSLISPGQYARRVRPGERYVVRHEEGRRYRPRAVARPGRGYRIVHQDRHLLVIDKAPDLLSVPTSLRREVSLVERLLEAERSRGVRRPALYAVHRLDRDTSGLIMYARTRQALDGLKQQFVARDVERIYVAVAGGKIGPARGRLTSRLVEDRKTLKVRSVTQGDAGKEAITEYQVTERLPEATVLSVRLATGRKNQIRVHLSEAGHPLVGDRRYGRRSPLIGRTALHARSLAFIHPVSGRRVRFESPLPDDLKRLIRQLRVRSGTKI
jgi:23S rRNA pseudouridine1911/1915/1917 synthase